MLKKILFIVGLLDCGGVFAMEEEIDGPTTTPSKVCVDESLIGEEEKADDPTATPSKVCVDESLIGEEEKAYIAGLLTMASSALLSDFSALEKAYPYFTNHEAKQFMDDYQEIDNSPCSYRAQEVKVKDNLERLFSKAKVQNMIRQALLRNRK